MIDQQAAEVLLHIQRRKAKINGLKESETRELELKKAENIIAKNEEVMKELLATVEVKELELWSSVAETKDLKKKIADRDAALSNTKERYR